MKIIEIINDEVESNINDYEWKGDWEFISDEVGDGKYD